MNKFLRMMTNIISTIEFKRVIFFSAILIIIVVPIQIYFVRNYSNYGDVSQGIMIEAFGFIADIILFGILITLYERIWKKEETIIRYIEELEDYRGWKEKEASYRIFGLIKRLHKLNRTDIDLSNCYFEEVSFSKNIFDRFDFKETLFYGITEFKKCNLQHSIFNNIKQKQIIDITFFVTYNAINFNNCNLRDSKFMNNQNFDRLSFLECDMKNADLSNSGFLWCRFTTIDFENANFKQSKFVNCTFENIDFRNLILTDVKFDECKFVRCKNVELILNNTNSKIIKDINEIHKELKSKYESTRINQNI